MSCALNYKIIRYLVIRWPIIRYLRQFTADLRLGEIEAKIERSFHNLQYLSSFRGMGHAA